MFRRHSREAVTSRLRLRDYDYRTPGTYFVTICTEQRCCLLGEICDDQMVLSPAGAMVESWWFSIPRKYPSVMPDAMVVMPNHIHGVIFTGMQYDPNRVGSPPSLSDVIGWYKSITTHDYMLGVHTEQWPRFPGKLWQDGMYDHIVRSDAALDRILTYIETNPANWHLDEENPIRQR